MLIPTGYGQVNFIFGGNGFPRGAQVALGFLDTAGDDPAVEATALATCWGDNMSAVQSTNITLQFVKVKQGPTDTGPESTIATAVDGTVVSNPLPPNVAVLAKKVTTSGGRKNLGKMFIPGACESQTDGAGLLTSSALTAFNSAVAGLLADMATADLPMRILHTDATTPTEVTALVCQQLMAQQHRRIRRSSGHRATP